MCSDTPEKRWSLERDANLLSCGEVAIAEAIDLDDFGNEMAGISAAYAVG